jgi:putative FmdB family regulatory protein
MVNECLRKGGKPVPIYEYYCEQCHMILNFFSRTLTPSSQPACPHCGRKRLERQISLFAAARKGGEGGDDESLDAFPVDERKMERALEALSSEADGLNDKDPRAAAQLMRKFSKMAGMEFNEGIEQALQRMEAGEDPEAVEAEMGDALDDSEPFVVAGGVKPKKEGGKPRHSGAPRRDDTLYDL